MELAEEEEEEEESSVEYKSKWGGKNNNKSLELDDDEWRESYVLFGTPGKENSEKPESVKYEKNIRINEVLPDPVGDDGDGEFIEIYNYSDEEINLQGWTLRDSSKNGVYTFSKEDVKIKKDDYLEIKRKEFGFSLNNDKDEIVFSDPNGEKIDEVRYEKATEGFSYSFNEKEKKWHWTSFNTPGKENKFDEIKKYTNKIRINEILPNPSGEENMNEFIELYNYGKDAIDLEKWIIKDSSKSSKYVFPKDEKIKEESFLKIYRKDFKFALNNSGEETVFLLNPNNETVDKISYKGAKEDVSYSFDETTGLWRWTKFLTPREKNIFDVLPKIKLKIDKDIYKNIYAQFEVEIKNIAKKNIKVKWDFGDGRKSYKVEARHKYEKEGKYEIVVTVSGGSEEVELRDKIVVEKFPRYDIEILSFMPNPKGDDVDGEWLEIKNKYKKKINFSGWGIATGKDKKSLVSHPINKDFEIKAGENKKINREYSNFSLNNKEGYVEVRYPNGKVADSISYFNQEGIQDDDIYQKDEENNWHWLVAESKMIGETDEVEKDLVGGLSENEQVMGEEVEMNIPNVTQLEINKNKIFFNKLRIKEDLIRLVWKSNFLIRLEEGFYYFNPVAKKEKHYAIKFWENFFII